MLHAEGAGGVAGAPKTARFPASAFLWLFPAAIFCVAVLLGAHGAIFSPDAGYYRLLALGQRAAVPLPFSARILGPAIAGWLGRVTGLGVDKGFFVLGIACLIALLALVAKLLSALRVPIAIYAAIFLMPFWVDIFHDYYLPDLFHAAVLAALLLALVSGRTTLAMLLLFPAYLARESTLLVAACLAVAAWRRISLRQAAVGLLATIGGALVSRHYGGLGAKSVQGISGGSYLVGKVVASFFHNILGLQLWNNTLRQHHPIWSMAVPHGSHLGNIHRIGVFAPSLWGPGRVLLAWFAIFGIGPAIAFFLRRTMLSGDALSGANWLEPNPGERQTGMAMPSGRCFNGRVIVFRFCVSYGLIALVLAPVLGASTDRLVEYAWPFFFVALPWFLAAVFRVVRSRQASILLPIHLIGCWLGWFGFREQRISGYVVAGLAALALNIAAYVLLKRTASISAMKMPSQIGS